MRETITAGEVWRGHLISRKKNGALLEEEATISPIGDGSGMITGYVGVGRDVTREVSLQKQLLQAQKMEAIGTLAGGIAHDFNNLLQVTLGYSELLFSEKPEDDPDYADLLRIHQAARSGAELVKSLLTFSRKVESNPVPMNLNARIRHVEQLLRRTIPRMIDIRFELAERLQRVSADPTQMEQLLMNLVLNARDAIAQAGQITVQTTNVTLGHDYCRLHAGSNPGDHVLLTVSDTGHGMDRETMDHIFEPFYTTKELGHGTGLGLAMVYGIVQQHRGHIVCTSEVGNGTTFMVYMPAISTESQAIPQAATERLPQGTETILLADDEDLVRQLGERVLERAGYSVLSAANGVEALDLYRRHRDRIALVILDLIMPRMGGKDCLQELFKIDPHVKVLISSGCAGEESAKEYIKLGAKGFVNKPFQFKELLNEVRKTLDRR